MVDNQCINPGLSNQSVREKEITVEILILGPRRHLALRTLGSNQFLLGEDFSKAVLILRKSSVSCSSLMDAISGVRASTMGN